MLLKIIKYAKIKYTNSIFFFFHNLIKYNIFVVSYFAHDKRITRESKAIKNCATKSQI